MHAVLVVDNDATSCQAMARLLTHSGDKATRVTSGHKALAHRETHIPPPVDSLCDDA